MNSVLQIRLINLEFGVVSISFHLHIIHFLHFSFFFFRCLYIVRLCWDIFKGANVMCALVSPFNSITSFYAQVKVSANQTRNFSSMPDQKKKKKNSRNGCDF